MSSARRELKARILADIADSLTGEPRQKWAAAAASLGVDDRTVRAVLDEIVGELDRRAVRLS